MHVAEIVSGGEITDTGPTGLALGNEVIPRIGVRFGFHEPIVFHFLIQVIPSENASPVVTTIRVWVAERRAWLAAVTLPAARQVWLALLASEEQRRSRRPGDLYRAQRIPNRAR